MTQVFNDGAFSTLASSINDVTTQLTVTTGEGNRFPGVGANSDFCELVITQAGAVETSYEIVKLVSRATDTFTIVRGWAGTTPQSWAAGSKVELRHSADNMNVLNALLPIAVSMSDLGTGAIKAKNLSLNTNIEYVITKGDQWEAGVGTVDEVVFTENLNNPAPGGTVNGDNWSSQWNLAVTSAYIFKFSGAWLVRHDRVTGEYIDTIQNTSATFGITFGAASESLLVECQAYGNVAYWTSANNGVSWTARSFPTWYPGWQWLEHINGVFLFISADDNYIYWSSDGIAWSRNSTKTLEFFIRPVYFKGYWYAVDYSTGYIVRASSLSGTWTDVWTDTYYGGGNHNFAIVNNNTRLLIINLTNGGDSWYSDDGTTKTAIPDPFGGLYSSVNFMVNPDGKYALVQKTQGSYYERVFYITNNGIDWAPMGPGLDITDGVSNVKVFCTLTDPDKIFLGATFTGSPYSQLIWDVNNYISGKVPRRALHGSAALPVNFSAGRAQIRARLSDVNGAVIQSKRAESSGTIQFTTLIPVDNTKPQTTEGTLVLSINFKPKRATSKLVVEADVFCAAATAGTPVIAALFTTGNNDALAVAYQSTPAAHYGMCLKIRFELLAGNTNSRAFHVRLGTGSGSVTFNGSNNTPYYGGSLISHLTVTEIGG